MITIDWITKIISVPQSYLTLISGTTYSFDTNQFRLDLKALEESEAGMPNDDTHQHVTEFNLAGVIYARFVVIINGYTISFEDTGSPYFVNVEGSNNNVSDVANVISNVGIIMNNSAGLVSPNAWKELVNTANTGEGTFGELATQWLKKAIWLGLK